MRNGRCEMPYARCETQRPTYLNEHTVGNNARAHTARLREQEKHGAGSVSNAVERAADRTLMESIRLRGELTVSDRTRDGVEVSIGSRAVMLWLDPVLP